MQNEEKNDAITTKIDMPRKKPLPNLLWVIIFPQRLPLKGMESDYLEDWGEYHR